MRPSDRTIRDELRREAARVPIPEDMWTNISRQLEQDSARKNRRRRFMWGEQWRPAVVLAVAAGFFWFALIPSLPSTEKVPSNPTQSSIVIPSVKTEPTAAPVRPPVKESDFTPDNPSHALDSPTGGVHRNVPQ